MLIEERARGPVLVDELGVEVLQGDPLCVGNLTYFYGGLTAPESDFPPMVALWETPVAGGWKACVPPDDPGLYRGPSVYDEVERLRRELIFSLVDSLAGEEEPRADWLADVPDGVILRVSALLDQEGEVGITDGERYTLLRGPAPLPRAVYQ